MNLKIALAAVLLISGGSYVSQAQQNVAIAQNATNSAVKAFEKKIAAYEKETNATKSAALLENLKKEVADGMAAAKSEYSNASAQGKADASGSLMRQYEIRTKAYNDLMMATRTTTNKASVVQALKSYTQTL